MLSAGRSRKRAPVFKRHGSIPVNENAVRTALETLKNQPGGILAVSRRSLGQLAERMQPQDFAALKLDLGDAQQSAGSDGSAEPVQPPISRSSLPWPPARFKI